MCMKTIPKSNLILKLALLNVKKIGNMPGITSIEYPTDSTNESISLYILDDNIIDVIEL